jgi:DNA-binding beta-propeller fold protein YncE
MTVQFGSGRYAYRQVDDWAKLPDGWSFRDVAAVAVDHKDRVYVFNRGEHPMIVFDRDGNFLRSWGEGVFSRAHGLHIGPDETLYCTDDGDHSVRKCTLEGEVLLTIGVPGTPAPFMSGTPFHRCTHTALSPRGDIYVSDGYGNACVHKYDPSGRLLKTWGEPGTGPGQFNLVHNICADVDGWLYVADRENHRVQVFDGEGRYETSWHNLHRPCGLCMETGKDPLCYVGELGPGLDINKQYPNIGPRLSIVTSKGELVARLADNGTGMGRNQFIAPHGLAVDSHGDIYVGEVSFTAWPRVGEGPPPKTLRSLRKLVRLAS